MIFLSAIAATGALAAPASSKPIAPKGLRITLEGQRGVRFIANQFDSDTEISHTFKNQGPFGKVTLELGPEVKNQDVRCQLVDVQETPKPIILTRGENIDINFSKGKPWVFRDMKESKVSKVTCGPNFLKTDQTTVKEIKVSLKQKAAPGSVATLDISQTKFEEDELPQEKMPEGSSPSKKFNQVQLAVGFAIKNRALRCQVLDMDEKPIIVTRGKNTDFTFGDGDNPNVWDFANGLSEVSKIVCDPEFKKDDASDQVNKKPSDDVSMDVDAVPAPEEEAGNVEPAVVATN